MFELQHVQLRQHVFVLLRLLLLLACVLLLLLLLLLLLAVEDGSFKCIGETESYFASHDVAF